MRSDALSLTAVIMSLGVLPAGEAELSAELADVAIRIDYGFYAEEYAVIEGARGTLARMSSEDAIVDYYRGFASLRLAQLAAQHGRELGNAIDDCTEFGTSAGGIDRESAEPWLLVAACSVLGRQAEPLKALLHERRREQALERAREVDADNPRIALIEAWAANDELELAAGLEAAIDAFHAWSGNTDGPDWGEAEALGQLGAV